MAVGEVDWRVRAVETEVENRWGPHAVACSSGTAALHLALEALHLSGPVAVPEFTMVSCARAVTLAGLRPVFIGCGSDGLMDLDALDEAASAEGCGAVMAVHVYGRAVDMDAVAAVAAKHGCAVVEDLAEAHGLRPHRNTDAACWSFYRNKIVAGEEGGAAAFRSAARAELARLLRNTGHTGEYSHIPRGCNYRLAPTLAQLIAVSFSRMGAEVAERRAGEERYDDALAPLYGSGTLVRRPPRLCPWVYDLEVTDGRAGFAVDDLNAAGVEARRAFRALTAQPEYAAAPRYGPRGAAALSEKLLYLPLPGSVSTAVRAYRALLGQP